MSLIQAKDLNLSIHNQKILNNLNFEANTGEILGIIVRAVLVSL